MFRKNPVRKKMKLWSTKLKLIVCILTPIIFSPLAASPYKESKCAYIILWMAVYWVLEPVHLTVTALMPVPLMPLFGILDATEVTANYMKEVLMMFLGGLAVAVAVEHCKLHERIALKVLMLLGSDTKWLMLGFMMTTMFLSMWISNTATTAMMVPIVNAVMTEIKSCVNPINPSPSEEKSMKQANILHSTLLLSIAYSANCGGTGTITGTSPNMILKGFIEELFPESSEITFASWMLYNVPGMVICVTIGWIILQLIYIPCWRKDSKETKQRIKNVICTRYRELGTITFHEAAVFSLFVILVFLWIFREPKFMTGWADIFSSETRIGDAVPVIFILFLLFLLPAEPWRAHVSRPLLEWSAVQKKLPWGLVILLGGGFALARGTQKSGLSKWLGNQLVQLSFLSPSVVVILLCASTAILTEIISNSTVATILLPVVAQMAIAFEVHPLYLMLPVTIASSYAFMLPVATGPNAIVFDSGHMTTMDMVKPGIIMNIICCLIQILMINTLGSYMFNLDTFPAWAAKNVSNNSMNITN
ncbi:solute carrier family 13 member 2-like [Uloborus diversus]|uniref:solute carrier family 13 member 2-like n=1 Tax=Uloborus diversus TaxID=327109 RepID=UPI00240A2B6D|nr:solute carrier family 13 member 2-like [Uloborus diversus]